MVGDQQNGRRGQLDRAVQRRIGRWLRRVYRPVMGEPIPDDIVDDVNRFLEAGLPPSMTSLLDAFERDAVLTRARSVVRACAFPVDTTGRRYPWPMV